MTDDIARLREYDADFTPAPVVRQVLEWLRPRVEPRVVLDPSAGGGVFGQQVARVWPTAHRIAIEPRHEEEPHLRRHYDAYRLDRFEAVVGRLGGRPDLIITNPPFRQIHAFVGLSHAIIAQGGWIVLLGLSTLGQSADGGRLFAEYTPFRQLRVGGRIRFRGADAGADQRDYSWWVWRPEPAVQQQHESCWYTCQLPVLPAKDRTWHVRPGTEETPP